MKQQWMLPAVAVAGGCAAFALRLAQSRTGFEEGTGLPVPGNAAALGLLALLAVCAALLGVLCRPLAGRPSFPSDFTGGSKALLALPVAGCFLMALSGAAGFLEGLGGKSLTSYSSTGNTVLQAGTSGLASGAQMFTGVLSLLAAAGLLMATFACRGEPRPVRPEALLLPPSALLVRLVLVYRADSVNPILWAYGIEILALAFLVMGFYCLASFAFHSGSLRRFSFCAGMAVVFCLCALADGAAYLSAPLLHLGGALALLGFVCLAGKKRDGKQETEPDF